MTLRHFLLGLVLSSACFYAMAVHAEVHAIVAGFNDYPKNHLNGAVADANDIWNALKSRRVSDLTLLTNGTETVEHFRQVWSSTVARAKPGDWIIFSFAGHGIREPEIAKVRRTRDGFEKGFVFPLYDNEAHRSELLRDEDLYDLFKAASAKGIKVLFVADACHAGNGIRGRIGHGAIRAMPVSERSSSASTTDQIQNLPPRPPIASVAVISGQIAEKSIEELPIDGQARGALSYAVARGIEGASDHARSGTITVDGLWHYVRNIVESQSENAQEPVIFSREEDGNLTIFQSVESKIANDDKLPELPDIGLFAYVHPNGLEGAKLVDSAAQANLIWDAARETVSNPAGDLLASDIDAERLQGAIDARRMLIFLQRVAAVRGSLETKVRLDMAPEGSTNNGVYGNGEKVHFELEAGNLPNLTVFDLNSDGTVQFLFAPEKELKIDGSARAPMQAVPVRQPFGGDFVVFIRSEQPLRELVDLLLRNQGELQARQINDTLRRALRAQKFQIGIQGLFTCRNLKADRQCADLASSSR